MNDTRPQPAPQPSPSLENPKTRLYALIVKLQNNSSPDADLQGELAHEYETARATILKGAVHRAALVQLFDLVIADPEIEHPALPGKRLQDKVIEYYGDYRKQYSGGGWVDDSSGQIFSNELAGHFSDKLDVAIGMLDFEAVGKILELWFKVASVDPRDYGLSDQLYAKLGEPVVAGVARSVNEPRYWEIGEKLAGQIFGIEAARTLEWGLVSATELWKKGDYVSAVERYLHVWSKLESANLEESELSHTVLKVLYACARKVDDSTLGKLIMDTMIDSLEIDVDKSRERYRRSLVDFYNLRGLSKFEHGGCLEAKADFLRAIRLCIQAPNPVAEPVEFSVWYSNIAGCCVGAHQYDDVEKYFESAIGCFGPEPSEDHVFLIPILQSYRNYNLFRAEDELDEKSRAKFIFKADALRYEGYQISAAVLGVEHEYTRDLREEIDASDGGQLVN